MSQDPKTKLRSNGLDFTRTIHNDTYDFIRPEQFDLRNRAVLITGASRGCGRATAISFARAGAGKIAIAARTSLGALEVDIQNAAAKAGKSKPQVLSLQLDVVDEQSVQRAAKQVSEAFGRLDILINNAGYLEHWRSIATSDTSEWWKSVEVNLKGSYLMSRYFVPLLLASEDGLKTILNLSSIGAHVSFAGGSAYQISKLALIRFGEFLNADHGRQGLLSFAIHPGGVKTELAITMPQAMHGYLIDTPELAADGMVWLTAERREWLRGRFVSCTWDMQELLAKRQKIEEEDLLKVRMDVGRE